MKMKMKINHSSKKKNYEEDSKGTKIGKESSFIVWNIGFIFY